MHPCSALGCIAGPTDTTEEENTMYNLPMIDVEDWSDYLEHVTLEAVADDVEAELDFNLEA